MIEHALVLFHRADPCALSFLEGKKLTTTHPAHFTAKQELMAMLEEEELKDSILLVFANKQDAQGSLNAQQISDALGLSEIKTRQWTIQETSALRGSGLFEGFDWLVTQIKGGEA